MRSIGVSTFRAKCTAILEELQRTGQALVITYRGRPLARVEPLPASRDRRRLGALRHLGRIRGSLLGADFPEDWEMEARDRSGP